MNNMVVRYQTARILKLFRLKDLNNNFNIEVTKYDKRYF